MRQLIWKLVSCSTDLGLTDFLVEHQAVPFRITDTSALDGSFSALSKCCGADVVILVVSAVAAKLIPPCLLFGNFDNLTLSA